MGCGSSSTTRVRQIDPNKPPPAPKPKPRSADSLISRGKKKFSRPESGASAATTSKVEVRNKSASSHRSVDSGIGNDSREESAKKRTLPPLLPSATDMAKLTGRGGKQSDPLESQSIHARPSERPAQLATALSRPARADSEKILESLRHEGLLEAPQTSMSKGGLRYELPADELITRSKPPPRLVRFERPNKDLNAMKQQLKEKLESAEKRRKQREQEKVERNRDKDARNLEVKLALLEFERNKEKEALQDLDRNVQEHLSKRSVKLDSIVERQKERDAKMAQVRANRTITPSNDTSDAF